MNKATLRTLRKRNGLTQAQAAEFIQVHVATYRRWESGEYKVPYAVGEFFTRKLEVLQADSKLASESNETLKKGE